MYKQIMNNEVTRWGRNNYLKLAILFNLAFQYHILQSNTVNYKGPRDWQNSK